MLIVILILLILLILANVMMFICVALIWTEVKNVARLVNKNTDDDFAEALTLIYNMDKVKDVAKDVDEVVVE